MKNKIAIILLVIMVVFCASAAMADGVEVTDYSFFEIDKGVESQYKYMYYVAYIKNTTEEPVQITTTDLCLYDENGKDIGVSDEWAFSCGSTYLDPGEVSCMAFKTYYGEKNYNKSANDAKLKIGYTTDIDEKDVDINLDKTNSKIKGWFDSSQYSLNATIKNINIKEKDKLLSYAMVLEDQNGHPIYMTALGNMDMLPEINKELKVGHTLTPDINYYKDLQKYYTEHNITPIKVNAFAYYMLIDRDFEEDWDTYDE